MRTTLDIDDDVLLAAKELAAREKKTAGQVLSDLARRGIHAPVAKTAAEGKGVKLRNGVPVFASEGEVISSEHVRRIMEQEGI
jgi:hypothetical protein